MKGYEKIVWQNKGLCLTAYIEEGEGPLVFFQHGLCGDGRQPAEVFPTGSNFRHAVLECRGHGSSDLGPPEQLSIAQFCRDLALFIQEYRLGPCIVGGISMGAAIALRLAVKFPDLVKALIIARPAWVIDSAPENMKPNLIVGQALFNENVIEERKNFENSRIFRKVRETSPDNLSSLLSFFDRKPLESTAELLTRISEDGPGLSKSDLFNLRQPTLVLGCSDDLIHPLYHAFEIAHLIPTANFFQITSKSVSRKSYIGSFRFQLASFLEELDHENT